ncbi:hypothetical protein V8E54_001873 [Elaphomyces granulatus]
MGRQFRGNGNKEQIGAEIPSKIFDEDDSYYDADKGSQQTWNEMERYLRHFNGADRENSS